MDVKAKIKLFVACPTTGWVSDLTMFTLRKIEKTYSDRIEFIWPEFCVRRIFHDFARNSLVDEFLKSEADIIWFLDSDVAPHDDVLEMVLQHDKWELAGAPYPVFMAPPGFRLPQILFTVYDGRNGGGGLAAADVPNKGTAYVDGLATGCMFIKRDVFSKLNKPFFDFTYDKETRALTGGEDLRFCNKVTALGYKFYVDYSMVCKHYKNVCLLDVNNYAIDYAKRSIEQYSNEMKTKVENLVAEMKRLRVIEKEFNLIKTGRKNIVIQPSSGLILKP